MIHLREELLKYQPIDIHAILESGTELTDPIRNSIVLYNKALEALRTGSEDIAIIELKKAVSLNPDFHEAINILGICYAYIHDFDKAKDMFERVAAAEKNGVNAQQYLKIMQTPETGGRQKPARSSPASTVPAVKPVKKPNVPRTQDASAKSRLSDKKRLFWDVVKYASGLIAGILIMLVVTAAIGSGNQKPANGNKPAGTDKAASGKQSTPASIRDSQEYQTLQQEYTKLEQDLKQASEEAGYYKNLVELYEVERTAADGNYKQAADKVRLLSGMDFKPEDKARVETLQENIFQKAAKQSRDDGYKYMNQGKYAEAAQEFSRIQGYGVALQDMAQILYNMGKCYMNINDTRNAMAAFEQVISSYPESTYASYSQSKIRKLQGNP